MFNSIIKGLGGLTRDLVELADSTYETGKEAIVDTTSGITNIPALLGEGYDAGLISDGDDGDHSFHTKPEDTTSEDAPEAPKGSEVSNEPEKVFPGAQ